MLHSGTRQAHLEMLCTMMIHILEMLTSRNGEIKQTDVDGEHDDYIVSYAETTGVDHCEWIFKS